MKQHNTLTLKQFIIRSIGAYFIALIIFCLFIFKVIPGCSLLQSKLVLFLLTVLSFGLIYFEREDRRNYLSIATNVFIPFGIYTTIAYMPLLTLPLGLLWGILITLNIIYIGLYLYKVKRRNVIDGFSLLRAILSISSM